VYIPDTPSSFPPAASSYFPCSLVPSFPFSFAAASFRFAHRFHRLTFCHYFSPPFAFSIFSNSFRSRITFSQSIRP
jgi:hypothetical protein